MSRRNVARPYLSRLNQWAARRAEKYAGGQTEVRRLDGWAIGSDEFRRHYKVEADDHQGAEWLAAPATQRRLLADPNVSLCSNGTDILAWRDSRGFGGDGFDITTVDALLEVLETIELSQ